MPPKKKTKVGGADDDQPAAVAVHQLEDIVADILGWLCVEDIMGKRRVCKKWKEAVKKTIVPPAEFCVNSDENYYAMEVMTTEMPNLQQIRIGPNHHLGDGHKWSDGEDPHEEEAANTADQTTPDIEIISNFSKLRTLELYRAGLNGRYPAFFNFPLLQKLSIMNCTFLKWDLEMLAGLPLLKELDCYCNRSMTGNINSLRVLKDTLEVVFIDRCLNVEGNFMDLADFPHLKTVYLDDTAVTGDIRDISEHDFSSLEQLNLPKKVYGSRGYEFQRISDASDIVRAVYLLKKQYKTSLEIPNWYVELSEDSPDWYESVGRFDYRPPFCIRLVEAGSRVGYRWETGNWNREVCEVNWLDPEPGKESSDYGQYIEELQKIENEVRFYRGFHQPPTEEEYQRLVEDDESDRSYGEYNESESDE